MYNAESLLSIARFWGDDITADQSDWLYAEVDALSDSEQSKFYDDHHSHCGEW